MSDHYWIPAGYGPPAEAIRGDCGHRTTRTCPTCRKCTWCDPDSAYEFPTACTCQAWDD